MSGIEQLKECLLTLLAEVKELRQEVKAAPSRGQDVDMTRPLTAEELCERWSISAETEALELNILARRCTAYGLKPLRGTRGWAALYSRADVLHAESFAGGKIKRRRHAA
jgi:hypothetical protein